MHLFDNQYVAKTLFCSSLSSIFIPSSVVDIAYSSFVGCTNLRTLEIGPDSKLENINNCFAETPIAHYDFSNCPHLKSFGPYTENNLGSQWIESIKFPVENALGSNMTEFRYCSKLKSADFGLIHSGKNNSYNGIFNGFFGVLFNNCESLEYASNNAFLYYSSYYNLITSFINCPKLKRINVDSLGVDMIAAHNYNITYPIIGKYYIFSGQESGELYINGKAASEISIHQSKLLNNTEIQEYAFYGFKNITKVHIPSVIKTIGDHSFENCSSLTEIYFESETPAIINGTPFSSTVSLVVPDEAYDAYVTSWAQYADQIVAKGTAIANVELVASSNYSDLDHKIGEGSANNIIDRVLDLTITGTINSYDILMIRNKMTNLHHLDLSNATIVNETKEYWDGCHTEEGILGSHAFSDLPKLATVKLPKTVREIRDAFSGCTHLTSVELPDGLEIIGDRAFDGCQELSSVALPASLKTIGTRAFANCNNIGDIAINEGINTISDYAFYNSGVSNLILPESLLSIGKYAFANNTCEGMETVVLPPNLDEIGEGAFDNGTGIVNLTIDPMLKVIGEYAFRNCNNIKHVYTYTLHPIAISQNTFDASATALLSVPKPSHEEYYYHTQWGKFAKIIDKDENDDYEFKGIYVNHDYKMDDETGILGDCPNGEMNETAGFINTGSDTQEMNVVTIKYDGDDKSASIIGNITAEEVHVEINIEGNKWYQFAFPFSVDMAKISCSNEAQWVIRKYNGEQRASTGTGWTNLPKDETTLEPGVGYIFQANTDCVLTLCVDSETNFNGGTIAQNLEAYSSESANDAGWNYIGVPFLGYYDIDDMNYDAPITIWNGESYEALRAEDDDYALHPFQAFFVQSSEENTKVTFDAENQETYTQAQETVAAKVRARKAAGVNPDRMLVNLEFTDGTKKDKTRVVFNDGVSMDYEASCDAAKFMSTEAPQIFTMDNSKQVRYAINERPNGDGTVKLGYSVQKAGTYTIGAERMDCNMLLQDLATGEIHDLSRGYYDFKTEAGTFEDRFLLIKGTADAINTIASEMGIAAVDGGINLGDLKGQTARIYTLGGAQVATASKGTVKLPAATYIVTVGNVSTKLLVK